MQDFKPSFDEEAEKQHRTEEDYVLGGTTKLPKIVLVDNGDWRRFYPKMEVQKNNVFDPFSCTNHANNNATEMMHKQQYGVEVNYSDRYSAIVSGTIIGRGNSHKNVVEARRKKGSVPEELCPFPDGMNQREFVTMPEGAVEKGLEWVADYEYGYEQVPLEGFEEALRYSPIQAAVDSKTNKTSQVGRFDHSIVVTCVDRATMKVHVFDSYLNRHETYDWDYPFSYGYRFHYKKVLSVMLDGLKMQFIRNEENGKIYLVDSDGRIHHIETEKDFTSIFGTSAWLKKDWIDVKAKDIAIMEEGESISVEKGNISESIKTFLSSFKK